MAAPDPPRWWAIRRAQNRRPATYRCPLCGNYLPALSEHTLLMPEGDPDRRRHAHTRCVLQARRAGRLPTREEWRRSVRPPEQAGGPLRWLSRLPWRRRPAQDE
ncbi:MAG: hypothetical protein ACYC91_08345 [Solirubrobacteraceae bacterium]